ncbi:MAG: hypothetical protein L0Z53_19600 [Acidobacteriales bacterium]|nr:hypothetical protein [Terriglobales bacterium]
MRKAKQSKVGFSRWLGLLNEEFLAQAPARERAEALSGALSVLTTFCSLGHLSAKERRELFFPAIESIAAQFNRDLAQDRALLPPSQLRPRLQSISNLLGAAMLRIEARHVVGLAVLGFFDGSPKAFAKALDGLAKLKNAADSAAASNCKVERKLYGQRTSNMARFQLLYSSHRLLTHMSRRMTGLTKEGPVIRLAAEIFAYSTGEVPKPGAFDRQVRELKAMYSTDPSKHPRRLGDVLPSVRQQIPPRLSRQGKKPESKP